MAHYFGFGIVLGDMVLKYIGGGKFLLKYFIIFVIGFSLGVFVAKASSGGD